LWSNIGPFIEGNDTMPTKREVLAVLGRDDLLTCHVGLEAWDRRVKDDLVEMLARSCIGAALSRPFSSGSQLLGTHISGEQHRA
jgi:hypothetical protein